MLWIAKWKTENSVQVISLDKIRFYLQKINMQQNLLSTTTVSPKIMGGGVVLTSSRTQERMKERNKERNSILREL